MSKHVVIVSHSGYGHTQKVAEHVLAGALSVPGVDATLLQAAEIDDKGWELLAKADAIVFGSPTYMGGPSWQFKQFADASSKVWFTQGWKDKLAGGFTNSLGMSGDKLSTLQYFVTLAMQHGMLWVGTALPLPNVAGDPQAVNRLASATGVMTQSDNAPADVTPPSGDLETAKLYGARIAGLVAAGS